MGTPNSIIAQQTLETYILAGVPAEIDTLCALGLDLKLLEDRCQAIKPQLPYMEGYQLLETIGDMMPPTRSGWAATVARAELTGTKVLWFRDPAKNGRSILTLFPNGSGSFLEVDVFLLRNGEWLIFYGGKYGDEALFTGHETPTQAIARLHELEGGSHRYYSSSSAELNYWPIHSKRTDAGHDQISPLALVLYLHLGKLLEVSIAAKAKRLATQQDLLADFAGTDRRVGLTS